VERPDVLIAVPAALSTAGLVLFSLWAYAETPKQPPRDAMVFAGAALAVVAWFAAAFTAAGPRFLPLIARAFGL
jgi:hypothetical protein